MSGLVIKVKYGDTLRRFGVDVQEDGFMDLDMAGLRAKILSLFKFAPDADLTLTYIDEDKDVVTLVDDDDLRDAIRQDLNPLRINVQLNSARVGRSDTKSSGSSTPMRSPQIQNHPLSHVSSGVTEVLKSIPEPFRDALSKLSYDLASKATSSAPVLTELVDSLSKLGLAHLVPASQHQDGAMLSTQSWASENPIGPKVNEDPEALKDSIATPVVLSNAKPVDVTSANDTKEFDSCNVTRGVGTSDPVTTAPMDLNLNLPRGSTAPGFSAVDISVPMVLGCYGLPSVNEKKLQKEYDGHINPHPARGSDISRPPVSGMYTHEGSNVLSGDNSKQLPTGFGHSSASLVGFNTQNNCPINRQIGVDVTNAVPPSGSYRAHPCKRSYSHYDSMGRIFHRGIRCDGCGVHPITGPRFKSKVKEDYDLCRICYSEMGNEAEYTRVDRPMSYRSPRLFKEFCDPFQHPRFQTPSVPHITPSLPHILQGCRIKPYRPKLDSRFIQDVNVIDGTMMAPATPFTKIWRMRNNGTVAWPHGTQLVWIGGDQFTNRVSVEVEIPVDGFPVDKELDIAVDFRAPQQPGRYVSYWRMASASGQKFGQRVWVLIQVDTSLHDSISNSFGGLNLNLPPESSGAKGQEIIDVNIEPVDDSHLVSGQSNTSAELVKPVVNEQPRKDLELEFPVNDSLLVGNGVSVPVPPEVPASVSYPTIDFSEVPSEPPVVTNLETSTEEVIEGNKVEETLLKELEEMGFKQIDLNKEILRLNEYNLVQSVDHLCGVAEWDPILEELQEMGFHDNETNKKLLVKNGGSIKRVVMDLIKGEKTE